MDLGLAMGLCIGLCVFGVLIAIWIYVYSSSKVHSKIQSYNNDITLGMSEESCKEILGYKCTESILKDGTKKCVWKLQDGGSTRIYSKGFSSGTYNPVKKITLKFKDNKLISKEGLNLD